MTALVLPVRGETQGPHSARPGQSPLKAYKRKAEEQDKGRRGGWERETEKEKVRREADNRRKLQ